MKLINNAILPLLGIILLLSGCYVDVDPSSEEMNPYVLDLQSQALVGYLGDGDYLRARVYDEADMDSMLADLTIDYAPGENIFYTFGGLLPDIGTQAFYLAPAYSSPNFGIAVVVDLAPARRYRLLIERVIWQGYQTVNAAGVTDAFEVAAGENVVLNITLTPTFIC